MADGDGIGDHLQSLAQKEGEKAALHSFSLAMRSWAAGLYQRVPEIMEKQAMVVYAGGDDLFGALHETEPGANDLNTDHLWRWLRQFPKIWEQCEQKNLTVSMGLVWADAKVPQREALQHARDAEASAKARGKNRFALRLLYASGNHLEWTCPWQWLDPILSHYTDREGRSLKASRDGRPPSWRHLAEDLQWLQSRQAIAAKATTMQDPRQEGAERIARTLWQAYFPGCELPPEPPRLLSSIAADPIAAEPLFSASFEQPEKGRRFDQWLLDLGQVMAGLEKYHPSKSNSDRIREEVPA
jgi:CRISPR-associated protein Cmr2